MGLRASQALPSTLTSADLFQAIKEIQWPFPGIRTYWLHRVPPPTVIRLQNTPSISCIPIKTTPQPTTDNPRHSFPHYRLTQSSCGQALFNFGLEVESYNVASFQNGARPMVWLIP